ncbi:radical SAM family heme chaperone HemW [Robiginitomaculum antarcticum]|uniref:radical SAM family heme chaperone HemW n=1 Tax=Robiginitomaculum antarcticum TaxID=437507 RepID=UPI00037F3B12|nr:radical SAM family heme chaperone HemW [Robiginitomaculum antarcticum]
MTPLAVYIHWPYCARICPYCDFNVYKSKGAGGDDLVTAILADLRQWREMSGPRALTSIHFGGGTPSLMSDWQIGTLITACGDLWTAADTLEIGLEANPDDADAALWQGYRAAGVNRLSLGIQSFDDQVLSFLGRNHDGAAATEALDMACRIFDNVSADLIFGHDGQSAPDWAADLDAALAFPITHLSAYQLTIEPGTAFGRAAQRGKTLDVNEDMSAQLYELTEARLGAAGFTHYEISNYARPMASQAQNRSAHNMAYWTGVDYVGAGPGAHGRLTTDAGRIATTAHMTPGAYINAVAATGSGILDTEALSSDEVAEEYVMMGLRIAEGFDAAHPYLNGRHFDMAELSAADLIETKNGRIMATDKGRLVLNEVTRQLLA